jgi:glycerophosphoryl diester phosphodiesterase
MAVVQLMLLLVVLVVIRSFLPIKHKIASLVLSFILAIIFAIQLSSVLLTGEIADYRFYENFNLKDVLSVADFFGKEGILLAGVIALTTFLIHYFGKRFQDRIHKKIIPAAILFIGLMLMSFSGGILNNAFSTLQLKFAGDASFTDALSSLQIDKQAYIGKKDITAIKGKNIIVLSLESLEKGYLGDKLKHLSPKMGKLARENTLLSMEQSPAGGWTSASMYIALTGVPAYFSTHGNSVFQSSHENKLTTLPDVLLKAGYDLQYFIGKKEYSGIDDMLKTHGFTVKSEKDFATKYEPVSWGIQDMDLFKEFKKALLATKEDDKPFAFFLSTIGTHFPNGVPDKRFDSLLPPQRSRLELMALATDYLIGDLIDFLRKEGLLSNTVFFIYPDHLLMGKKSSVIDDFDERSLFVLTNASLNAAEFPKNKKINQIDIPKLILEGAKVDHNSKFLTDFVSGVDKNAFLRKNAKSLLQLNDAALTTLNFNEGMVIEVDEEKEKFTIKNEDEAILVSAPLHSQGFGHRIMLDENIRPIDDIAFAFSKSRPKTTTPFYLDVFWANGHIYASLKNSDDMGLLKKDGQKISFNHQDIELLTHLQLDEETNSAVNGILLESNSWNAKKGSNLSIANTRVPTSRGLTVVALNSQKQIDFRTFDTYGSKEDAQELISILKSFKDNAVHFIILAHDSAAKSLEEVSGVLDLLGFKKLRALKDRQAYIAHNLDGKLIEKIDDISVRLDLAYPTGVENATLYFSEPRITFESSIDRYIAHAGGQVEGIKYTDSKEALDYNYAQGFRLFELDIIETSDGHFVAAHDWNHWKKETNFQGKVPVSLTEFKKHKIRKKYTSLDMSAISQWFSQHPDALLISDKVNRPKEFAQQFVDKNRLVMELFSLKAIEEALQIGVRPLISEKAMAEIKGDVVSYLVENKIKFVGLSRRSIQSKEDFLKKCRENDIRVYVYHVNFDAGKDEQYVLDNEIGRVYGMYADKWLPEFQPGNTKE